MSVLVCFPFGSKSAINVGVSFMVCEKLDQLEWDFIQARAGSLDIDSSGWTDREFSCLRRYWITSGRGIRANAASGTKYHSEKKAPTPVGAGRKAVP